MSVESNDKTLWLLCFMFYVLPQFYFLVLYFYYILKWYVSTEEWGKKDLRKQFRKTCSKYMYKISRDRNYLSVSVGDTLAPMCLDGENR